MNSLLTIWESIPAEKRDQLIAEHGIKWFEITEEEFEKELLKLPMELRTALGLVKKVEEKKEDEVIQKKEKKTKTK